MKKHLIRWFSLLALLLAGCRADQVTKAWAMEEIKEAPRMLVPGLLEFRYAENRAIAFSMLRNVPEHIRRPLIFGLAGISLTILLTYGWMRRSHGFWAGIPFVLILAGAIGNLQDRFQKGFVVDFVHVHWRDAWSFPIFNVADSLITVGMGLLLWQSLRAPREAQPQSKGPAPEGASLAA